MTLHTIYVNIYAIVPFYILCCNICVCVCEGVCASSLCLQHVSSGECPGVDEPFEPLTSVTLLQQCRKNNLKQEQLQ